MQASKGHSPTGEPRQSDKSGHGKNASQQGTLTNWRAQTEGQIRTWKECKPARGTHFLGGPDRDKSGYRTNMGQQGALTYWRVKMMRQVRTGKCCKPERGTHILESPDGETSQDTKII